VSQWGIFARWIHDIQLTLSTRCRCFFPAQPMWCPCCAASSWPLPWFASSSDATKTAHLGVRNRYYWDQYCVHIRFVQRKLDGHGISGSCKGNIWFGNICEKSIERQEGVYCMWFEHCKVSIEFLHSAVHAQEILGIRLDSHGTVCQSGSMQSSINLSVCSWLLVISNMSYVSSPSNID
jgi:hypothetical protein